ncbi:hypothetical protein EVAR_33695_1 [Eumeta japonica]|uniref:Uncharacterized protein n=1 Tax=Eumeta variegata TaxID=151549 RepID=A0A4C1VPM9_EUMVA|nr:hypothetical protein EVAR_33695_1 [Eumeta japonica]
MNALNRENYLDNPAAVSIVLEKLTLSLLYGWYDYIAVHQENSTELPHMAEFLNREAKQCRQYAAPEDLHAQLSVPSETRSRRDHRATHGRETAGTPHKAKACLICNGDHLMSAYVTFKDATVEERWEQKVVKTERVLQVPYEKKVPSSLPVTEARRGPQRQSPFIYRAWPAPPDEVVAHRHLRDIADDLCYEYARSTVLIRQDNWPLIITRAVRGGRKSKPAASYTELGWLLHDQDKTLKKAYEVQMVYTIKIDYAEITTGLPREVKTWCLLHFAVVNLAKSKLSIVHDVAAQA